MGKIAEIEYQGQLRTRNKHLRSGDSITTDAPTDNQGKGEAFSPTDLVATALGNCMLTVMGIKARQTGADLQMASAEVHKTMQSDPRKISKITIVLRLKKPATFELQQQLEETALTCPVALSHHPEIEQDISFIWE